MKVQWAGDLSLHTGTLAASHMLFRVNQERQYAHFPALKTCADHSLNAILLLKITGNYQHAK